MAQRRLPNGRFAKVTVLPDATAKSAPKSLGGGLYLQTRTNAGQVAEVLQDLRTRTGAAILNDPERRAAAIQQRLRAAILGAYTKAATGRMARGIFARATKTGAPGGPVETVIRVSMQNYREAAFITNIGGSGYFKELYPVPPYRIYAKGVQNAVDLLQFSGARRNLSGRKSLQFLRNSGVGRLKIPRQSSFLVASRQPGRGGGESRSVSDINGPAMPGDRLGHFFFYPLWVDHPGFAADVISAVALEEGARFQSDVTGIVSGVSTDIPAGETEVTFKGGGISVRPSGPTTFSVNESQTSRRIR